MPTDTDKTLNGKHEPFRRPMVWGRPPATVFRTGPLPSGGDIPARPEAPRMQPSPGVLTGSMIPRAAPAPANTRPPEPREPQAAAPVPATSTTSPDLTVRPLPTAAPQEPVRPVTPTPVEATAAPARIEVASATVDTAGKPAGRTSLYVWIAVAAVAVLAMGGWIWSRSYAVPPAPPAAVTEPASVTLLPEAASPATPPVG